MHGLTDATRGTETVLLVEDDPGVRRVAGEALRRLGYHVLRAGTAEEALALAGSHTGPIDLILSDIVLPELSGRELTDRVRRARPNAKALFMSGYAEDAIERHGVLDAGLPYIAKPFTLEDLARKVRAALDG